MAGVADGDVAVVGDAEDGAWLVTLDVWFELVVLQAIAKIVMAKMTSASLRSFIVLSLRIAAQIFCARNIAKRREYSPRMSRCEAFRAISKILLNRRSLRINRIRRIACKGALTGRAHVLRSTQALDDFSRATLLSSFVQPATR